MVIKVINSSLVNIMKLIILFLIYFGLVFGENPGKCPAKEVIEPCICEEVIKCPSVCPYVLLKLRVDFLKLII